MRYAACDMPQSSRSIPSLAIQQGGSRQLRGKAVVEAHGVRPSAGRCGEMQGHCRRLYWQGSSAAVQTTARCMVHVRCEPCSSPPRIAHGFS